MRASEAATTVATTWGTWATWATWARRAVPVLCAALFVGLGVRGLVRDEARFAWGMFDYVLEYRVEYRVVLDDDRTARFTPGPELKRVAALRPGRTREGWYGLGAVRSDVEHYLRWVLEHRRAELPPDARALEAVVRYRKHGAGALVPLVVTVDVREAAP